jgi:uncharacterized protein (TIGR02147 family)
MVGDRVVDYTWGMQADDQGHPLPAPGSGAPPRLLHYLDYRDFIRDHCAWRKGLDPAFSQRVFAREAELPPTCSSLLPGVVNARRNLSANLRIKFGKALGLSEREYRYFDLLVQFNQAKGMIEKNHFFAQLAKFRNSRARIVGEGQYRYYAKWHHSAVWTYFTLDQKQRHPAVIGARLFPPATAAQVEESIGLLLALGLIKKTASGYAVTDKHLTTEKDVKAMATRQHLHDLAGLAMGALDAVPPDRRQFSALMFSVSEAGFRTVKDRIGSFQEELREIVEKDAGEDRIYTLTLQLFPNSQGEAGPGLGFTAAKAGVRRAPGKGV